MYRELEVGAVDTPPAVADADEQCPVEAAMAIVGGKWKVAILFHLQERGTLRFAQLQRSIEGVTAKVLAQQLRELERDEMLVRRVYPEVPPRVEYSLSERGRSFTPVLAVICRWGESLAPAAAR